MQKENYLLYKSWKKYRESRGRRGRGIWGTNNGGIN